MKIYISKEAQKTKKDPFFRDPFTGRLRAKKEGGQKDRENGEKMAKGNKYETISNGVDIKHGDASQKMYLENIERIKTLYKKLDELAVKMTVKDYAGRSELRSKVREVKYAIIGAQDKLDKLFKWYQYEHGEGIEHELEEFDVYKN